MSPIRSRGAPRSTLALLICGGIVGGLVVAEIAIRLAFLNGLMLQVQWGMPDNAVEARAHRDFTDRFGTFSYEDYGFRKGSGLPYDCDVLFVGDSFTEGCGVSDDETFARAVERALRRDGIAARSLNAGHRGFGPAQELRVLRRVLMRAPVDALVVQSFPMNDFSDNIAFGGFGVEDGRLVEYDPPQVPLRARLASSVASSWLHNLYILRLPTNAMLTGDPAAPFDSPTSWDLERALLNEIVVTARRHSIPVVVLIIPTERVPDVSQEIGQLPVHAGEMQRFEHVRAFLKEVGAPYVDAGEIIADLRADAANSDGSHFSRDGNRLIGEAIAERLKPLLASGKCGNH